MVVILYFVFVVSIKEHNHGNNYVHMGEELAVEVSDDIVGILILHPSKKFLIFFSNKIFEK